VTRAALTAIIGLAALAAPAPAAVTVSQSGTALTVQGDGADDAITLFKEDPFDAANTRLGISRDGGGITLEGSVPACSQLGAGTVVCDWSQLTAMMVKGRGGDDRITGGSPAAGVPTTLDGGPGHDTYRPNGSSTGPDRYDDTGEGGHDTLDLSFISGAGYWMRAGDGTANDGRWDGVSSGAHGAAVPDNPPTEQDDVTPSIEGFIGTPARDFLEVYGPGAQSMQGGSGWDDLRGQSGNDTLDGQGGNDRIEGGSGDDHVIGGPGEDTLFGDYATNTQAGADRVEAADGEKDAVIDCGPGDDTFSRDAADPPATGCETEIAVKPANTARPVLSGTARSGETLSVTKGTWTGTEPITYTYRWLNCVDAADPYADCKVSREATAQPSYRLTDADVGRRMLAVVIATNAAGSTEATPATFSGVVQAAPPANTARPVLSGTARVGEELAVTTGTWTGTPPITFAVRWLNCVDAADPYADCKVSREFATARTYRLQAADAGRRMLAVVRATNGGGSAEATPAAFSAAVAPAAAPPANTAPPSVAGTARAGEELVGSPGTWTGDTPMTFRYVWRSCERPELAACVVRRDGPEDRVRLTPEDVGRRMLLEVVATNAAGSASALAPTFSGVVEPAPSPPQVLDAPAISGAARVGETLSATPGRWAGDPTGFAYRWHVCAGAACRTASEGTTLRLDGGDTGRIVLLVVTATNAAGSTEAAAPPIGPVVRSPEPRCAELVASADLDLDGLSNGLECGADPALDLPAMGATPFHKDLFVEIDSMVGHQLSDAALDRVVAAFARAPLLNPDGRTGITLHVDNGPQSTMDPARGTKWGELSRANTIPHQDNFGSMAPNAFDWGRVLDPVKEANFERAREGAFRYALSIHEYGTPGNQSTGLARGSHPGTTKLGGDFLVALGRRDRVGGDTTLGENAQAGTFMHELGHTLGLGHGGRSAGGGDNTNGKPNYLSIMNYRFQLGGLRRDGGGDPLWDFGRFAPGAIMVLDESRSLNETTGISGSQATSGFRTTWTCSDGTERGGTIGAPADFDCNGRIGGLVQVDLNNDGNRDVLSPWNDWAAIVFAAGGIGGAGAGAGTAMPVAREPSLAVLQRSARALTGDARPPAVRVRASRRAGRPVVTVTARDDRRLDTLYVRFDRRRAVSRPLRGRVRTVRVRGHAGARRAVVIVLDATGRRTLKRVSLRR
jgi:hypothetical protein